jgi:hypothetical protein
LYARGQLGLAASQTRQNLCLDQIVSPANFIMRVGRSIVSEDGQRITHFGVSFRVFPPFCGYKGLK